MSSGGSATSASSSHASIGLGRDRHAPRPAASQGRTAAAHRRGFVAAAVVLIALLAGGVTAAALTDGSDREPPPDVAPASGPVPVAGPDGTTVGEIPAAHWKRAVEAGPPLRTYGSKGRTLQSLPVERGGELVGYYTTGPLGFVPLATALDAAAMDELLATVPEPLSAEEARALHAELAEERPR